MECNHAISKFQREYQEENRSEVRNALYADIEAALQQRYGPSVDETIRERVRLEWETWSPGSPERADLADLHLLVRWLKKNKEPYWFHGSAGANFILYLLGITSGNPLPPHYYCPKCHQVIWCDNYKDGFDLPPDRICEKDGAPLCRDGHNIPWQAAPHCFAGMMCYHVAVAKPLEQVCSPSFPGLDISYDLDKARISPHFLRSPRMPTDAACDGG